MTHEPLGGQLHARLFADRTISLFGQLDDEHATAAAAELWALDAVGDQPINVLMSLRGGTVRATLALIDAFDIVGVEIRATSLGALVGPPLGAFAAATTRLAAPSARFHFQGASLQFSGSASELDVAARHADEEYRQLIARLAETTGGRRSVGDVLLDFERSLMLSASEAVDYGIVDSVLSAKERIQPQRDRPPFGFGSS